MSADTRRPAELAAAGVQVEGGVMEQAAEALNRGFFTRMRRGTPYVRSKLGVSLDGRTALANGKSQWITSAAARADVHRCRARSSAVLTGSGTIVDDDPRLDARRSEAEIPESIGVKQPLRVVSWLKAWNRRVIQMPLHGAEQQQRILAAVGQRDAALFLAEQREMVPHPLLLPLPHRSRHVIVAADVDQVGQLALG